MPSRDEAAITLRHVRSYQRRPGTEGGTTTVYRGPVATFTLTRPDPPGERTVTCPHCEREVTIALRSAPQMQRLRTALTITLTTALALLVLSLLLVYGDSSLLRLLFGLLGALALVTAAFTALRLRTDNGAEVVRDNATYHHPSGTDLPEEDQFHVLA
ncbi:hypothetical protein [Glycomyces paridis]|uniref:Uncharacterized protein n=1 Tax=Glycomyces paridis TaxID=2126555 RepID=A0A4S8PF59_9ACTN|nr:hypothetical protein [Glycomyces paridis]THV26994.1 hypothetical protein E9998_16050 [Glycomyces paridis]